MADAKKSLRAIFDEASELAPGQERQAWLDQACGTDAALRANVEELLQSQETAGGFLGDPKREAAPASAQLTEREGDRIGRYKLLQKIGEGGCGTVYMAEQTEPVRRRVALKVIKLGMDTRSVIARFEAERQALAMMDHASIARVLDAGATDSGRPYFVMELVRGIKVTDYCDQNNLSTHARLQLFIQVCQAVQHAHQKGIIHRDLKPSNILVTANDGVPLPKVIDFGIAKATADIQLTDKTLFTRFEMFIGTPAYMSPEQAGFNASDIDTRTDIYALGVLLYELLTGQTPFDGNELMSQGIDAMRRTIREKEPPRPSTRLTRELVAADTNRRKSTHGLAVPTQEELEASERRRQRLKEQIALLRGDLDWIVLKCLEKDRARRYATANGLAVDIQRHLANEPVVARPPSTAYKLQKAWQRNKIAFNATALVAMALILGTSASIWQAVKATRARKAETEQRFAAQTARTRAESNEHEAVQQRQRAEMEQQRAERFFYDASMNLVQSAFEQNDFERVRQLLEETRTNALRGFEWAYWEKQMHRETKILRGHVGAVMAVAFSPDSRRVVSGGEDGWIKVWDTATGRELLSFSGGRLGGNVDAPRVGRIAFSPDGQRILADLHPTGVSIFNAATGEKLLELPGTSGAFSPDGQRIATAQGRKVVVYNARGEEVLRFNAADPGTEVVWVSFSADGRRFISTQGLPGRGDPLTPGDTSLWNATNGQRLLDIRTTPHNFVGPPVLSPDNQRIATLQWYAGPPTIWDGNGKLLGVLPGLEGIDGAVFDAAFSSDSRQVLTAGLDFTARLYDANTLKELRILPGHSGRITAVAFSPNGQGLATASEDGTARIWERAAAESPLTIQTGQGNGSVALSQDGRWFATLASRTNKVMIWDVATRKLLRTLSSDQVRQFAIYEHYLAISPNGQRVVAGQRTPPGATVWDANTGAELFTLKTQDGVNTVAFSPDGKRLVTAGFQGPPQVWDAATGGLLFTLGGPPHPGGLAWSPDGRWIVAGAKSDDGTFRVWDAETGKLARTLRQGEPHSPGEHGIDAAAFSPDSLWIVTGSTDGTTKVWERASGRNRFTLPRHKDRVVSVAFSPDGRRILTGSGDGTAKLWDVTSQRELLAFRIGSWTQDAGFFPDGHAIFTRSVDGKLRIWEAATPEQMAAWDQEEEAGRARIEAQRLKLKEGNLAPNR
jgi:eukaryotic-like serine/threonine-protein kinase